MSQDVSIQEPRLCRVDVDVDVEFSCQAQDQCGQDRHHDVPAAWPAKFVRESSPTEVGLIGYIIPLGRMKNDVKRGPKTRIRFSRDGFFGMGLKITT